MSTDGFEEMCPNCVTPWKCNGPHEFPPVAPEPTADTAAEAVAGWPVWWEGEWWLLAEEPGETDEEDRLWQATRDQAYEHMSPAASQEPGETR